MPHSSHIQSIIDVINAEADALKLLAQNIDDNVYQRILSLILNIQGKVILTGIGKSGLVGAKIAATMASTGTPAQFMHTGDAGHGDMGMVRAEDLIIAISNSGQNREFLSVITYAKKLNIPLIGITTNPQSLLGRACDEILLLPNLPEACPLGLAPMTSTTMVMALGDGLAAALTLARGFQREDFGLRHLAGALGARTKTVGDFLREKDNQHHFPHVNLQADFATILRVISEGRLGATAVLDDGKKLAGIITDGDIRRGLEKGDLTAIAAHIMTSHPVIASHDMMLLEVLDLMRSKSISVILAKSEDGSTSFIHLQDLLATGI